MNKKITNANKKYLPNDNPRKILSLDGGGIRGVLTLEILQEMENQLRITLKKGPDFYLGDYFDFIGGTSTGAIIAAGLSLGMKASTLLDFYQKRGEAMFRRAWLKTFWYKFRDAPLEKELIQTFGSGDIDIESGRFKSLLLVVTMNHSTDSPWPISNNPWAKYNLPHRSDCNLRIPLYQLVRASTAAPTFFKSERLKFKTRDLNHNFSFIDGGVTPYNNPAFLMYKMATMPEYRLDWPTGERKLLIASVGTGSSINPSVFRHLLKTAQEISNNLMYAMQVDQDINCRVVGRCIYGNEIDREIGDLIPKQANGTPVKPAIDTGKKFSYIRYNADISQKGLHNIGYGIYKTKTIRKMDKPKNIDKLRNIGRSIAKRQVKVESHFTHFLNPTE